MLFWSPAMVLKVRKVITKLEECCPWYIFTEKQLEMAQINITANFEKSCCNICNFRPQKSEKVL